MSTIAAKPVKVAIIGASGTYGKGILARAERTGVEAVVITRSPHKFNNVKPTTMVVEAQLDEEETLKEAITGCDGVISALGDDGKRRPKTHNLPHRSRSRLSRSSRQLRIGLCRVLKAKHRSRVPKRLRLSVARSRD